MQKERENDYRDTKDDLISSFNEAKLQIFRLHELWEQCNKHSVKGQLIEWKWKLDCIYRELSPDLFRNKERYLEEIKQINKQIGESKTKYQLYNALQEKEIFLRNLQDQVGKGTMRKEADEDTMI